MRHFFILLLSLMFFTRMCEPSAHYRNGNDWYLKNSTEQTIGISYVQTWNLKSSKHETQNYLVCNSLIFALFLSNYFRNSIRIFYIYLRYYTKFV